MPLPKSLLNQLSLPVVGAPMFLVSSPKLVISQCCSGIIGTFPTLNARPQETLRSWIQEIKEGCLNYQEQHPQSTVAPFGINLVALDSNKRLEHDLNICLEEKVPIIITSMRAPSDISQAIHSYGGIHFHDVINRRHAEKAIEAGVDGLVLVTNGAGGHAGMLNPFAFVKEIRSFFDGIILLAGCLTSGKDILASQILGADLAYIGTRFIATKEANASEMYKNMLVSATAQDIIYTPEFTGVNINILKPSLKKYNINPDTVSPPRYKKPNPLVLAWKHWRLRDIKKWKDLWSAGQGVGNISSILSVADYVDQLEQEYDLARNDYLAL
ncbi:nitronate monooxygenase [bacterium]|nr:nitronate monooxygenase [bacterium]